MGKRELKRRPTYEYRCDERLNSREKNERTNKPSKKKTCYLNRPDPIAFIPLAVDTTGRLYDEFILLLFLHAHWEASALATEFQEESDQFCFLRASCFTKLKGDVGLIMTKPSVIRVTIPLDLSSRSFIPFPRFIRSCRPTPCLAPSLLLYPPR